MSTIKYSSNIILVFYPTEVNDKTFNKWFSSMMKDVMNILNEKVLYRINIVKNYNGESFGYAYIYISNVKAANLIQELNEDGSKPVREVLVDNGNDTGIWGEDDDIIYEPCEPIYKRPLIDDKYETDFKGFAKLVPLKEDLQHNVLCCRGWDETIPIEFLEKQLQPFVSINQKGRIKFPKFNINYNSNIVFITLCEDTDDAQNALLMLKKLKYKEKVMTLCHAFKKKSQ